MNLLEMKENITCAANSRECYVHERDAGILSYDTQFVYALDLLKTNNKEALTTAINLLESCFSKVTEPDKRRESLYLIAIANTKLGNYQKAISCCNNLIDVNRKDHQAVELKEEVERRTRRDGLVGMAVIGGSLALLGALGTAAIGLGLAQARKKKR